MPEHEFPKLRPHPFRAPAVAPGARTGSGAAGAPVPPYAELCVTSNYTFLTGASHPEEYVERAAELGYRAVAVTDVHSLAGVVRAHVAARERGVRFVVGACLRLVDMPGCAVRVYPTCMAAYRGLCRLLTVGKRRSPKGECRLSLEDLAAHHDGLLAIVMEDRPAWTGPGGGEHAECADRFERDAARLKDLFRDDRLSLAVCAGYAADDADRLARAAGLSARLGVALVATNDARYHTPERRMMHDVLACIRAGCTLEEAGLGLAPNAERYLKPPGEMARLLGGLPGAIGRTIEIAERTAGFDLGQLRYEYPEEVVPAGRTAQEHLAALAWEGAERIYGNVGGGAGGSAGGGGVPAKVRAQIEHELALIAELNYAPYFLTVHDIVRYARTGVERSGETPAAPWKEILCQGRGAAANSAVCYCLGVTAVDPARIDVLFERFVSRERNEPPDIDIDFEHERREEVIQYIYRTYGRERAALTAEVITYRRRSAVRDVGKALGLSLGLVDRLAKESEWFDEEAESPARLRGLGLNPQNATVRWLVRLVRELMSFPRHLSQHVGGFVITRSPLCELVPVENAAMPDRTVIEWDKDDIDAMGMLKVDVLGLGMLTCIRKAFDLVNTSARADTRGYGQAHFEDRPAGSLAAGVAVGAESFACPEEASSARVNPRLELHTVPAEDPAVYDMICAADTVGVFQIESRAQMSMLPRLRPRCFYDLVIEVAIVRPGPIQGDMVHPYLRRRNGEEAVAYPDERVQRVLGKTLGVPLFQEQAMALAIAAAGFTPGEADQLRRAMAAWKRKGDLIFRFGKQIVEGMTARGYAREFAERCFEQIKGFSEYGFPESHAASFALLVYASAWLKRHRPAEFCAALLNSQPMGFYAPAQIVRDAREHGVRVLPVDVNFSAFDCTMEGGAVRLGMRLVNGVGRPDADKVRGAVERHGAFASLLSLWRASGAGARTMRRLGAADAFGSMGLSRQRALWEARLLREVALPLFDGAAVTDRAEAEPQLPRIGPSRQVVLDYDATGLSLRAHPVSFVRGELGERGVTACAALRDAARMPDGETVTVAGLVLVRQRPGTASGVTFMTVEDETGIANLVIWRRVYAKYRRAARARMVIASGRVQRQGEVVHVVVTRLRAMPEGVEGLSVRSRDFH